MKKNILVILCDQLRKDFLPIYGNQNIKTPNIDKIAAMGVTFDKAITVSTVCAPARASMMTGRYVSDHRVWTNDIPFREGLEYLPMKINELGYRTGCFGKLHHFPARDTKGFKVSFQMEENRLKESDDYLVWLKKHHPEVTNIFNINNMQFKYQREHYYEHYLADRAIDFIKDDNSEKPYFTWLSFQGPHGPMDPPKEQRGSVTGEIPQPIPYSIDSNYPENGVVSSQSPFL